MSSFLKTLVVLLVGTFSHSALARVQPKVESTVSRNVDSSPPIITVTLPNIEDLKDGDERYVDRLTIFIDEIDSGDPIPIETVAESDELSAAPYIWTITQEEQIDPGVDQSGNTQHTATIKLQLKKNQTGARNLSEIFDANNGVLTLNLDYDDDESDTVPTEWKLERSVSIADEAPTGVRISGSHLSLTGKWAKKDAIAYSDGKTAAPAGVGMFVTEANQGDVVIDGRIFNTDAEKETTTDCTINTNAAVGSNCVTCNGGAGQDVYLDTGDLPGHVEFASSDSDAGSVTVGGLKDKDGSGNPITYIAFLIYQPDGAQRSACYTAVPRRNLTWTELLDDEIEAKEKNPRCFIATAAYGSAFHAKVDLFRWFRDHHLKHFWLGRKFISFYYRYSPPVADFIAERPWLRATVRGFLWLPAKLIEWTKSTVPSA